ncbi:Sec63 [Pleurotus pulmonarius]|nr:Sec63 [Pleurotus pulmonarius]KAF4579272.1 Sec63 [Pleurotus pulmonarius]KAF4603389.1 Sec63 [Pleurotus pulmonarius]
MYPTQCDDPESPISNYLPFGAVNSSQLEIGPDYYEESEIYTSSPTPPERRRTGNTQRGYQHGYSNPEQQIVPSIYDEPEEPLYDYHEHPPPENYGYTHRLAVESLRPSASYSTQSRNFAHRHFGPQSVNAKYTQLDEDNYSGPSSSYPRNIPDPEPDYPPPNGNRTRLVVNENDNIVLSAPTGSGKTVIFELAIIRMLTKVRETNPLAKCVYMSPTKALCSERFRDWSTKFDPLGIKCCELTGDTVQFGKGVWGDAKNAAIMNGHGQTLSTIQLFLVDEVHILNEPRGSTLEVVVSRMKRNGTEVRFLLVSATVPNIRDIASWIGNSRRDGPSLCFEFGEEFRPCKLTRFIYGIPRLQGQNEFAFNNTLDFRLFSLIQKHAVDKPVLVFCSTRSGSSIHTELASIGIGVHHAGLNLDDRRAIEDLYLKKILRLVVATSTLAVGVNLHKDGIAIIMCETELEEKYRNLVQGKTILESGLHSNLSEHLNSEVALGTITNLASAKTWLRGSFLFQRIQQNPKYYALGKDENQTWEEHVDEMVIQSINKLQETQLVDYDATEGGAGGLASTDFGDIMSKFYIRQTTMALILALPNKTTPREILEALSAAEEFSDIKIRGTEKTPLNKLRTHNDIRFSIKRIEKPADKVFLLLQAILGGISLSSPEYKSADSQPNLEALGIFRHISRIARALVEVAIVKKLGSQVKCGLEVLRCLTAKAWEDRPVVLRQIEQIGEKSLKVLAEHGVASIDSLRAQDTLRIETLLNRRPPFGLDLMNSLKSFPQYFIKLKETDTTTYGGQSQVEKVSMLIECGLKAEWVKPKSGRHKANGASMTSILTVTSDLEFIDYRRIPTGLLHESKTFDVTAQLDKPSQSIVVYIASESLAGVGVVESYKPNIPVQEFPTVNTRPLTAVEQDLIGLDDVPDFWDMAIDDDEKEDLKPVTVKDLTSNRTSEGQQPNPSHRKIPDTPPKKLPNGKCNHTCKDKSKCRHLCCREGMDDPPNLKKRKAPEQSPKKAPSSTSKKNSGASAFSKVVSSERKAPPPKPKDEPRNRVLDDLDSLHKRTNVASNLGLQKDKRIKLTDRPSSPGPVKPKLAPPKLDIEFTDIKHDVDGYMDPIDAGLLDEDDLPETHELLKSISSRSTQDASSDYSNEDMDALIMGLSPAKINHYSQTSQPATQDTPPKKRPRLSPSIASPLVRRKYPSRERYISKPESLFLDISRDEDEDLYWDQDALNDSMRDGYARDDDLALDWTSVDILPSHLDTSAESDAELDHPLDIPMKTNHSPSAQLYGRSDQCIKQDLHHGMEISEDTDDLAELAEWLHSGAVDIIN